MAEENVETEGATAAVSPQIPTPAPTTATGIDEPSPSSTPDESQDGTAPSTNDDVNTTNTNLAAPDTTSIKKPTWHQEAVEEGTILIEELPPPPPPAEPVKKAWIRSSRPPRLGPTNNNSQHSRQSGSNNTSEHSTSNSSGGGGDHGNGNGSGRQEDDGNFNTAAEKRSNQQQLGSKPKLSNMSLLSSAVAHATLERCLLGVNGGVISPGNNSDNDGENKNGGDSDPSIDYSKQCKAGHIIDILELRRLSSRGVPDEPPEVRARSASAPVQSSDPLPGYLGGVPGSPSSNHNHHHHTHGGGINHPHRSYRPLVWRVLLGYLPPRTDLWNNVLSRDRKLYDTLVKELFSSTCPAPHDRLDEEELRKNKELCEMMMEGNRVYATDNEKSDKEGLDRAEFVIDDDDEENGDGADSPTKKSTSMDEPAPPPPPQFTTPTVTPGLLSARMQQEWVRGEGGQNTIFDNTHGGPSPGANNLARISPMCAMNTPRTRIRKEAFRKNKRLPEEVEEEEVNGEADTAVENDNDNSIGGEEEEGMDEVSLNKNEEEELSSGLKESLLLPNDDGDGDDVQGDINATFSISVGEEEEVDEKVNNDDNATVKSNGATLNKESATNKKNNTTAESSPGLTRSISITKTSSEDDEGVELCRQSSHDNGDDDLPGIPPSDTTDEEENILLLDEIRKDVIRTHPDLRFFLEPKEDLGQKRYAALERILFVWAKLNKGVRYVQGMNEIVGTLYFVLAHDSNEDWANEAEADTYFLFNSLMVEMRDVFVPDLDEADTGIHGRISNMITLLSLHDPEVRCHLDSVGIDPSFYSVRWLTTLLSREFLLPDTIRLWDSMFASTHKDNFLRYVSVTMVMVIRDQLLEGDFSACLRLLQAYPPTNLDRLLESSRALWIYESQITLACHKGGISLGHALRSINPPPAIIMAYGLPGGVAPPIREQMRQAGARGLEAARGAAKGAGTTVGSAGRSFFGKWWRTGSGNSGDEHANNGVRRSKSTM